MVFESFKSFPVIEFMHAKDVVAVIFLCASTEPMSDVQNGNE
jgi:hypothetical protein